jgi:hypothetical protein
MQQVGKTLAVRDRQFDGESTLSRSFQVDNGNRIPARHMTMEYGLSIK